MEQFRYLKKNFAAANYTVKSIIIAISAFGAYTSMYAFRKAFSAGTFENYELLGVDYKVWLVIAQVMGYTLSKFYGIRFIAEVNPKNRGKNIVFLVSISWFALLGFAVTPNPYNIIFLFINGFPLGMIWGLVFGYIEGRKSTEFMAAVMSVSLIFASGFVKTVGRLMITVFNISDYWMPFVTGLIFILPLVLFVWCLELAPAPTEEDKKLRVVRIPMNKADRAAFLKRFLPGLVLTIVTYVFLTIMRDIRDNFEVEIWQGLGMTSDMIYSRVDTIISIVVLVFIALLILVKNNLKAFAVIHLLIIAGCLLMGCSTILFQLHLIGPVSWMIFVGIGLYFGYIPYNTILFERLIAAFRCRGNVGFIMYVADAAGYCGSTGVLLVKELVNPGISWAKFFENGVVTVAVVGGVCTSVSLIYFLQKAKTSGQPSNFELNPA